MDDAEPDVSIGDDAGEYANLLSLHNKNRCMHNAGPLVWDTEIYKTAEVRSHSTEEHFLLVFIFLQVDIIEGSKHR